MSKSVQVMYCNGCGEKREWTFSAKFIGWLCAACRNRFYARGLPPAERQKWEVRKVANTPVTIVPDLHEHGNLEELCSFLPMCGDCLVLIAVLYAVSLCARPIRRACEKSWGWSLTPSAKHEITAYYGSY